VFGFEYQKCRLPRVVFKCSNGVCPAALRQLSASLFSRLCFMMSDVNQLQTPRTRGALAVNEKIISVNVSSDRLSFTIATLLQYWGSDHTHTHTQPPHTLSLHTHTLTHSHSFSITHTHSDMGTWGRAVSDCVWIEWYVNAALDNRVCVCVCAQQSHGDHMPLDAPIISFPRSCPKHTHRCLGTVSQRGQCSSPQTHTHRHTH